MLSVQYFLNTDWLILAVCCTAELEPIPEGDTAKDYLAKYVNPTLLRGLSALCEQKPAEPVVTILFCVCQQVCNPVWLNWLS